VAFLEILDKKFWRYLEQNFAEKLSLIHYKVLQYNYFKDNKNNAIYIRIIKITQHIYVHTHLLGDSMKNCKPPQQIIRLRKVWFICRRTRETRRTTKRIEKLSFRIVRAWLVANSKEKRVTSTAARYKKLKNSFTSGKKNLMRVKKKHYFCVSCAAFSEVLYL